ncbi:MAG TPA: hypothetical protein VNN77_07125 [candidate division Zixibacteria bacterium]|nr:hypothetical protein [candidate division Zixibacteria bacterium]
MKRLDINPYEGQNWAWPQKTWFQERLNAVKARENEARRKGGNSPKQAGPVEAEKGGDQETEKA